MIAVLGLASVNAQTIRVGAPLQISISGVPVAEQGRLNATYPVSQDGYISMWKIGRVKASGMSKSALALSIASKYKAAEIYTDPVFQILNTEDIKGDNQLVTIGGQVKSPGPKQWTKGMTLYTAVQSAGGETPFAAMNRVILYRNGKSYVFDLTTNAHKAEKVYALDVIEVPEGNIFGQ